MPSETETVVDTSGSGLANHAYVAIYSLPLDVGRGGVGEVAREEEATGGTGRRSVRLRGGVAMARGVTMVAAGALVTALAGCGGGGAGDTTGWERSSPTSSTSSTGASIPALADGTIPWVDEAARDEEFQIAPSPRRVSGPDTRPCRAAQLEAVLRAWLPKGDTDDGTPRSPARGLIGIVRLTNVSKQKCSLQGEVPTRLFAGGRTAPVRATHAINDEGRQRVTVVAPGEVATLRLDWSAPYCGPSLTDQELHIELPHDGGTLRSPITEPSQPACTSSETHPNLTSVLSASAFDVLPTPTPTPSDPTYDPVIVTVEPPAVPPVAGQELRYAVTLANPTGADIALKPCPGYIEGRFSTGSATVEPVNERSLRRLNCRTRSVIPAGDSLRFEMRTDVPRRLSTGRKLMITWRLLARGFHARGTAQQGTFTVTAA